MNIFTKRFLILVLCGVGTSCGIVGLTSTATYKPYGVPDLLREQWNAKQAAIAATGFKATQSSDRTSGNRAIAADPRAVPVAVVDEPEFDFGILDAGTSARHAFVIRNAGKAPLSITAADTSCKCTLSETSAEWIAPGATAEVTLTWNTGSSRKHYRQYAIVRTNDPNHKEIELAVRGEIRTQLGFNTGELAAPAVSPGSRAEAETIVFSQTLDAFEISDVQSQLPGFQFRVEPVSDALLHSLEARSAWKLLVSTNGSLNTGSFVDVVRVSIQSDPRNGKETSFMKEITFRGNVLPPITFYGSKLYRERGLELGITNAGTELVSYVIVRVRGEHLPKSMEVSQVEPAVLQTDITPLESRPGVYKLTITVPADASQIIFNTERNHGFVEVRDPENPTVSNRFPVYGAILAL